EYEMCTKISEITCSAENLGVSITEISKEEYATLRPALLPKNSVIQGNENLDFLATQARFYKGDNFLLVGTIENENLHGIEFLGDISLAPGVVHALSCKDASLRTPGKDIPFAMFHALEENATEPTHFGFAFD
ncbi:MAG: hypothetical protein IJD24_03425, partial [Agathobacter sp.]|nr:hypothetical protein [Agathobacter sp.]